MALLETVKNLFSGKKKKEAAFVQLMRSADIHDYLSHIDEKGFAVLENFENLQTQQAQDWLNSFSQRLFNDDPQRKMDLYLQFKSGQVSALPRAQRSAIAVYFTALSYFLMEEDIKRVQKEMIQESGKIQQIQKQADKKMAKAIKDVERTEKEMKRVDKAMDKLTAKMEEMMLGRSSRSN